MSEILRLAIIDDEEIVCKRLKALFRKRPLEIETFTSGEAALARLAQKPCHLVLTDIRLPDIDGMEILARVKAATPQTEVILITGYATLENAVEAVKQGAFYYLAKPFTPQQVEAIVVRAEEQVRLALENQRLRRLLQQEGGAGILGISTKVRDLHEAIAKVASIDCTVLIQGESGTGKELVARAIHQQSRRAEQPFVAFNCGGFPEELIANELFGHEKGAYTGAEATKIGLMEAAHGGTLFLDEIGEMPPAMQVKLLRVIQDRQVRRLGSVTPIQLDIRLIAATNRDLAKEVEQGRFRQDLYYRLKVVLLKLPPLRERREDIPVLLNYFLEKYNEAYQKNLQGFSREGLDLLMQYAFPGNVRELENIVASAVALSENTVIHPKDLPEDLSQLEIETLDAAQWPSFMEMEKEYLQQVLAATNYNKNKAAEILKMPRTTLWRKLRKYGLQ
ncbi:MAG: sigma-54-dependent transcriptional regulator [Desulfobacca sp.]|uniref:sigma-54-dependent transcriptional regulator n=1 Tax=Desulfobacca sp. TaxID=2067990 RepID=UPI00404B31BA